MIKNEFQPDLVTPPGDTLLEILEEKGMSQAEFANRTGRPKKTINEIIKGKTAITHETAIQFERVLGTSKDFWINREHNYRVWLIRLEERKKLAENIPWMRNFPLRAMIKMGWIHEFADPIDQTDELLRFFGVASPIQWQEMLQETQWRQSPTFAANPASITAWLRMGEISAQSIKCAPYDEGNFRKSLSEIRKLTILSPQDFIDQLVELCSRAGVIVTFVPEIPGTHVCGATRWINSNNALIILSLRYKTDDHFWFTFFHEAGHVLLHGKKDVFIEDNAEVTDQIQIKEKEADQFAAAFLIPPREMRKLKPDFTYLSHADFLKFSRILGIAPGIIVGRFQHDGKIPNKNFNRLKRKLEWPSR
jgi:addiction module HigA family antidote